MSREKRTGIIIMMVGACMPLISLFFMSGYNPNQNIIKNIYSLAIPLSNQTPDKGEVSAAKDGQKGKVTWDTIKNMVPRSIGFRFILAFGILLMFAGFIRFDGARQKAKKHAIEPESGEQEDKGT